MTGTTLGPYRIDRELGAGGMGTVYAATVTGPCRGLAAGTRVALKVVHPHLLRTEGCLPRFLRETEVGRAVAHENVVRTHWGGEIDGRHVLVMEYVEGQTLRSLLFELERVPEELCRHIGREIAKGLAAIHAAGAVHRDVKPENVLITPDHAVKVMDLGVARLRDEVVRLSRSGAFVGSLHYAAPEALREGGARIDGRADLHALGLVLYELVSGSQPFDAGDVAGVLARVLHETPRRLGDVQPQVTPFFEEVVHRLLAKDPADRFPDAAAVARVLDEGEASEWWRTHARSLRTRTRRALRRSRIPRETVVHGREEELALLRAEFDHAARGDGRVVLVEGEAGIGKTRLVDELVARLQRDGADFHFLCGSYPPGGAATAAGAFSAAYREHFGEAGCAAYLPASPALVAAFDAFLRGESPPPGTDHLTKDSLQTCFVRTTRALAAELTTVVLLDDMHFAPEEGRALFMSLALAVPGHRVLLVGSARSGVPEDWTSALTGLPQTTHLRLGRLGPKDLARLLADSLHSEQLARELGVQIALKSDGNPFFAFEILRGLREGQFLAQRGDGTWVTTRAIDRIEIPSSVLDLVKARVATLSPEERDVLDVAACWGYEFDPSLVAEATGVARIPLFKMLAQIERAHRLVRSAGRRFVFDHHQVQEALHESLPEVLREEYHAALARALETRSGAANRDPATLDGALCVELCDHFLAGARGESARRYIEAAQAHLAKGYQSAQMVSLSDRALAVPGLLAGAARARSLLHLAAAFDLMGRRARQEACAREAGTEAEAAGDGELEGRALIALGTCLARTARQSEAEEVFLRALDLARRRREPRSEATALGNLGVVQLFEGRLEDARRNLERTLEIARAAGDRAAETRAVGNLGSVFHHLGRTAEAERLMERQLELSRESGHREGELSALANLGAVWVSEGRHADALRNYELVVELAREHGIRQAEAVALHNAGSVHEELGDDDRAVECHRSAIALGEEIGHRYLLASARLCLGALLVRHGEVREAKEQLVRARDLAAENGIPYVRTLACCRLALLPGGDAQAALDAFEADRSRLSRESNREARWLLWRATGDRAHLTDAKRLLDEALACADGPTQTSMLENVHLNREIVAAAAAERI